MLGSLGNLFNNIKLSWIDSAEDIDKSDEFKSLLLIFPNLKNIFGFKNIVIMYPRGS